MSEEKSGIEAEIAVQNDDARESQMRALVIESIGDDGFFSPKGYWTEKLVIPYLNDGFSEIDALRIAVPKPIMVSSDMVWRSKNPLMKPNIGTKDQEIHWECVVPMTRYHWDLYMAALYILDIQGKAFHGNPARAFIHSMGCMSFHPDIMENFSVQTFAHVLRLANGQTVNTMFQDPVNCLFQVKAIQLLLMNNFDLESEVGDILKDDKICHGLVQLWDDTEYYVERVAPLARRTGELVGDYKQRLDLILGKMKIGEKYRAPTNVLRV